MKEHEDYCGNEGRISKLEAGLEVNSNRINSFREALEGLDDKVDEFDEKHEKEFMELGKAINDLSIQVAGISAIIKNIGLVISILGLTITLLLAVPDLIALL